MRKKKLRLLAVLLAACMLCSCSAPVYPRSTDEPQLQFYYCTGEGADTGIGAFAARPVSVPDERPDAVLQQYLTAPAGEGFSLPDGLSSSCAFDSCEDGTLTLLYAGGVVKACGEGTPGERVTLSVRTERIRFGEECRYGFALTGIVRAHSYTGGMLRTTLGLSDGQELIVSGMGGGGARAEVGETVHIYWKPACAAIVERGDQHEARA